MSSLYKMLEKIRKSVKDMKEVTSGRHTEGPAKDASSQIPNSGKPANTKHVRADTMTHQDFKLEKALGDWEKEGTYSFDHSEPDENGVFEVYAKHEYKKGKTKIVGSAPIVNHGDHIRPIDDEDQADFLGVEGGTHVDEAHRRKGLASAMYQHAEKVSGLKLRPATEQTDEALAMWNNPNKPFGKSEGIKKNIEPRIGVGISTGISANKQRPENASLDKSLDDWKKEGYSFSHEILNRPERGDSKIQISAHDKNGNKVGESVMYGRPDTKSMIADIVHVEKPHQRKGIASGMYKYIEDATGWKMRPSDALTPKGEKLWNNPKRPFGKSEELKKGSRQRKIPFNPQVDVDHADRVPTEGWTTGDLSFGIGRDSVPYMKGNARERAIHKLHSQTQVRKNPVTGEREFLMFRGMKPHDVQNGGLENLSSFTTDPHKAILFNRDLLSELQQNSPEDIFGDDDYSLRHHIDKINSLGESGLDHTEPKTARDHYIDKHFGKIYKAWVPESAIHSIPSAIGSKARNEYSVPLDDNAPVKKQHYHHEKEVIVHTPNIKDITQKHYNEIKNEHLQPEVLPRDRLRQKLMSKRREGSRKEYEQIKLAKGDLVHFPVQTKQVPKRSQDPLADYKLKFGERTVNRLIDQAKKKNEPFALNTDKSGSVVGVIPNHEATPTGKIGEGAPRHPMSDPFAWHNTRHNASKKLLEEHKKKNMPAEIHTGSDLIAHDDYMQHIPRGSTINLYSGAGHPGYPSDKRLINAGQKLENRGIKVNYHGIQGKLALVKSKLAKSTRKSKAKDLKEESVDYINARDSKFQNQGEDIKRSARHKAYEWKGAQQAEDEGRGEELINFKNLSKYNPADLTPKTPSDALSAVAAYYAFKKFPKQSGEVWGRGWHADKASNENGIAAVEIESPRGERNFVSPASAKVNIEAGHKKIKEWTGEELKKQARAAYAGAYDKIKAKAEELANSGKHPNVVMQELRNTNQEIYNDIRRKFPNSSLANPFIDYHNKYLHTSGYKPKKTSAQYNLQEFMNTFAAKNPMSKERHDKNLMALLAGEDVGASTLVSDEDKARINRLHEHAKAVTSGKSLADIFDLEKKKKKAFDPTEFYPEEAVRVGPDRGWDGHSAHSHQLMNESKIRGIQYGNTVTDPEREFHLEQATHALKDLSDVLGLPDSMMSFNGRLGLAFGARGKKKALAHYEPDNRVINLTRKHGVGSLAHEWGHMFDHILPEAMGLKHGIFATDSSTNPYHMQQDHPEKQKVMDSVKKIVDHLKGGVRDRMIKHWRDEPALQMLINGKKMGEYWLSNKELFARAFERYVDHKLAKKGRKNTYLSAAPDHGLWTTKEENEQLEPMFDELFNHFKSSDFLHKSFKLLRKSIPEGFVYVAMDGDNAGAQVEKAALQNNIPAIKDISERIKAGSEAVVAKAEKEYNAKTIIFGGDDIGFLIPRHYANKVDELRALYKQVAGFSITAGIAHTIPDATKALLWGKMHGKDQSVTATLAIVKEVDSLKSNEPIDPKKKILESGVLDKSYALKKSNKYNRVYKLNESLHKTMDKSKDGIRKMLAWATVHKSNWRDQLKGGLADNKTPADFNKDQLIKGVYVELEHTNDPKKALEITMDHLTEDPNYYDKLAVMESKDSLRKAFLRGDTWIPERHDKEHPEDNRYRAHVNTNKTMAWALKGDHAKKADEAFATSAAAAMPNIAPEHHENFKQMVGSILRDKDRHARTRFSKSPRNAPVPDVKLRHMHSALKGFEGNDIKTSKSNPNRIYVTAVRHGKGGDIAKDFGNFDVWSYEGGKFQHHPKPDMSDIGDNLIQGTQKQVSGLNKLHKSMSDNKDIKHVATVGVVSGNSILMGKRSDTGRYTTPGGHLDPNEKPKAGAFRELMEEAGIEPSSMHYLDSERVRCEDGQDRMIHAFVCFGKHDTDSSNDPDQEVKKWEWVDCSKGLPENVRCNLHSPKNVVLDRLGIFKYRK